MTENTAEELRDEGIERSADSAERASPGWADAAYDVFEDFIRGRPGELVSTEDVRLSSAGQMLPPPPDSRAWGGVARRVARSGLIVKHGYDQMKAPKSHMAPRT